MTTATGNLGEGGGRLIQQVHSNSDTRSAKFKGTNNPRKLRVIAALLRRPMPREHIDREAGCSNGPELIASLRRKGLTMPCVMAPVLDRDGREVKRGIYHLTESDRQKLLRWIASRKSTRRATQ